MVLVALGVILGVAIGVTQNKKDNTLGGYLMTKEVLRTDVEGQTQTPSSVVATTTSPTVTAATPSGPGGDEDRGDGDRGEDGINENRAGVGVGTRGGVGTTWFK